MTIFSSTKILSPPPNLPKFTEQIAAGAGNNSAQFTFVNNLFCPLLPSLALVLLRPLQLPRVIFQL